MLDEQIDGRMQQLSVADDDGCASAGAQARATFDVLTRQCQNLIEEVRWFSRTAEERLGRGQGRPEVGPFNKSLLAELKSLEKIKPDETDGLSLHHVASSNIPYYLELWDAAKRSHAILNIRKGRYVDIVADHGLLWIKVSTFNNRRLLYELAKEGCERYGLDPDDSDDEPVVWSRPDEEADNEDHSATLDRGADSNDDPALAADLPGVSILKTAAQIAADARAVTVRGARPRLLFVLPRIYRHRDVPVDAVLATLESLAPPLRITVLTGSELATYGSRERRPPLEEAVARMLPTRLVTTAVTERVNVDCSVLLAMASDISHLEAEAFRDAASVNRQVRQQIKVEAEERLMERIVWPLLMGGGDDEDSGGGGGGEGPRRLVCTEEAAGKFRQIVDVMGTDGERARADILMGTHAGGDPVEEFQKLSQWTVPKNWRIPVEVIPADEAIAALHELRAVYPGIVKTLEGRLTDINKSVFIQGWALGITTLTSNRSAARTVEDVLERTLTKESRCRPDAEVQDEQAIVMSSLRQPSIRLLTTARSLLAKEKTRRDAEISE